jgi:hypothetical protein
VTDHGKITAGSEKGSQEAEEQKEVSALTLKIFVAFDKLL